MSAATATPVANRGMITVSIMLATIMQALDTTIANVALPHMQGSLSAAQDQISWVLTSYIVAAAVVTPLTGWLSNRIGRKRLFLISVAGFTAASLLCGIATSLGEMVLFRLAQGVFGAGLVPLSQAVLLDINPRERHGSAMAIWGAGIMVGPILGPTLGGYLTEVYDWRWVFLINLPVGLVAFAGILTFLPESTRTAAAPLRPVRVRDAGAGHRRVPAHARPRRAQGLVHLGRDRDRSSNRGVRPLSVHRRIPRRLSGRSWNRPCSATATS